MIILEASKKIGTDSWEIIKRTTSFGLHGTPHNGTNICSLRSTAIWRIHWRFAWPEEGQRGSQARQCKSDLVKPLSDWANKKPCSQLEQSRIQRSMRLEMNSRQTSLSIHCWIDSKQQKSMMTRSSWQMMTALPTALSKSLVYCLCW